MQTDQIIIYQTADGQTTIENHCSLYPWDTGEIFYEGLGYTYLDLANFVKTEEECVSEMDELPPFLMATIFESLFNIAEYTNLSKEEQAMYDQDLKRKWDMKL